MDKKPGESKVYRCFCCVCETLLNVTPSKLKRQGLGFLGQEEYFSGRCPVCKTQLTMRIYPNKQGSYMVSQKSDVKEDDRDGKSFNPLKSDPRKVS